MGALSKITHAGFDVSLTDTGFDVSPAIKLTQQRREYLKVHREEIICELAEIERDGRVGGLSSQQGKAKQHLNDRQLILILVQATHGTSTTPQQLWSWLELDDIADIQAGICNLEQLRCYVLSRARYPEAFPAENKKPFPEPDSLK